MVVRDTQHNDTMASRLICDTQPNTFFLLSVNKLDVVMISGFMESIIIMSVFKRHLHWRSLSAKPPATRDRHYYTCLGQLGQHNENRNDPNGTAHFKKCKLLFEYQHLLLLRHLVVKVLICILR
jgi:hypothetical protein